MEIVWLGEPACHDRDLVGGKAAHLSRLAESYRVPPGFCLTSLYAYGEVGAAAGRAHYQRLEEAYRLLASHCEVDMPSVAVRSSAIDEDGSSTSFAGLHETYLNVAGAEAIAEAAARCWHSARSDRALAYRREMGLQQDHVRVAVLVQQLVPAESAVVAFSGNPVTGSQDELVIEANWGLGESIASGVTSPDTYAIARQGLQLRSKSIGEKARMTVAAPGGTKEVDTPRVLRTRAVLSAEQLIEVARLLLELENWMGRPVDVECAYSGGLLYLLQCRAATGSLKAGDGPSG